MLSIPGENRAAMLSLISRSDAAGIWHDICNICPKQFNIKTTVSQMKPALALITISTLFLLGAPPVLALNPLLEVSQYAHTAWTSQDGFSVSAIFAMAQTSDGYLWLGSESGLYRFDGVHAVHWKPPAGENFNDMPYALLVTHDGTLWIGTFTGLFSWNGSKLTQYREVGEHFVTSLLEDREGTVWAGILGQTDPPTGQLCAVRDGRAQCYLQAGAFGTFVWSLSQDRSGTIWAGAETGLWRWKPGPPHLYAMPSQRVDDMLVTPDGQVALGVSGGGLRKLVAGKLIPIPIYSATNRNALLSDRDIDSNKLLRDRDGGLWIGTRQHGLIHIHNGRTDVFTSADGLSGDITCSLFEDHEGNIWFGSSRGLDRFRELPVTSISTKQGLSSPITMSLLAPRGGSMWVGTLNGLTRWNGGEPTAFHKGSGLPDDSVQSLFEDYRGRIWATFNGHGLAYFDKGKFVETHAAIPSKEVYSITGDKEGNLWLSGNRGLSHVRDGRLIETFPWSALGRDQQAKVVLSDPERGGLWLAFWKDGGVLYFSDGHVRASYSADNGLAKGKMASIRLDGDGALWAASQEGGISRIKDGRITTLTTKNGLPCDTIHWSIEDNDHAVWLYTGCGLVRITRSELDAWIADPQRKIETRTWDAGDGVRIASVSNAYYNPPVAKAKDGKLWFKIGEGVEVIDPHHLNFNEMPPPVHVEQIVADQKNYWQSITRTAVSNLRLPARTRDLTIDYTALSLVAPEKIHFKYMLEGQDQDWKEVINERQAQYTNLSPRHYRFRVIASNNSGVWNEQGDALEFSVAPAYYQTNWFRVLCVAAVLALLWAAYQLRVGQLHHEFEMTLAARVGERTRIARDLHDTLLQSFHGILLHLQTLSNELPGGQTKQKLDSVIGQAEQAIVEGRDAVKGLRTSTVERNDLALAIRTLGEELAASNSRRPDFTVQVEGAPRNLHPILRDEVYRIVGEALRNAFRHAAAQRIEVEIRYDEQQLRLRVRDDGKGIDPQLISDDGREGHFGLRGMRERAKLIGSRLTVWSELNSGTEVELSIPAERAYLAALERRRSGLLEKLARKSFGKDRS